MELSCQMGMFYSGSHKNQPAFTADCFVEVWFAVQCDSWLEVREVNLWYHSQVTAFVNWIILQCSLVSITWICNVVQGLVETVSDTR